MRIDVANMSVVLLVRHRSFVKSCWLKKLVCWHIPVHRIGGLLTPQNPLNNNLGARNFHKAKNFDDLIYLPNLVLLGDTEANRQGWLYQPSGRSRYGKGPGRARVNTPNSLAVIRRNVIMSFER